MSSILPSVKSLRQSTLEKLLPTFKAKPIEGSSIKDKSVLIYDYGLHTEFAIRLSREFGKVYYYCHWEAALPKSNLALIGSGFPGVEHIDDFWDYVDKVDLICCFDTYTDGIVEYLRKKGYRVWGAGKAEVLETNRNKSRQLQKAVGLPVQKTDRVVGFDALITYLKANKDKWVKINQFRGDIETFHHIEYDETEAQYLGKMMHDFGAKGDTMEFVLEDPVGEVEAGYDGWCINGEYPEYGMYGYENKDSSYLGRSSKYENIPSVLTDVNLALSPIFKKLNARTFFSSEVRIDKNKVGYLIDPTVRIPLPPSGIHLEMWGNLGELIWHGSAGNAISPTPTAIYGAEILLTSDWAKENWTFIDFPESIRRWVKLRMAFQTKDGKHYAIPGESTIATVVGLGNTPQEAIDKVKSRVAQVKARDLTYDLAGLQKTLDETVPQGRKLGVKF